MFGHNSKVDLELNREVEKLIKTGGKEKIMPIVQAGEPVLRQQTIAYDGQLSRKTLDKLIDTMRTTMLEAPGVGLAATQIGLGLALAVVEDHAQADQVGQGTGQLRLERLRNSPSTPSSPPATSRSAPKPAASTKAA
mgnify:CR=1 FL=1